MDDASSDVTVVYKLEPVDEDEAAFLPPDLPEVVLDASNLTPDADTQMMNDLDRVPNGRVRSSNISEYSYSPQVSACLPNFSQASTTLNFWLMGNRTKDTFDPLIQKRSSSQSLFSTFLSFMFRRRPSRPARRHQLSTERRVWR